MIRRSTFDPGLPRKLQIHLTGTLIVGTLDPLVSAESKTDDHVVPDYTELFLRQVVSRANNPTTSIRDKKLRFNIATSHGGLTKATTAYRNTETSITVVKELLLRKRCVPDTLEV